MDEESIRKILKDATHVAILVALLLGLWLALVWTGILGCSSLPYGCDIYWHVIRFNNAGKPMVLIAHGNDGLGDPELLSTVFSNPNNIGVRARVADIQYLSLGNLKQYDMVIVTKAKTMSTEKMKMFIDYAIQGGWLVWTGDAGTELTAGDMLYYEYEREGRKLCEDLLDADPHADLEDVDCVWREQAKSLGPWARVTDENMLVQLDLLLSSKYIGNFCGIKSCADERPFIGMLKPEPEKRHPLIFGIRPDLEMYGDFAIADDLETGGMPTKVLSVEYSGYIDLPEEEGEETKVRHIFPIIVTSGVGGKIIYYALPPESFMDEGLGMQYPTLIENLYYGTLMR